MSNPLGEIVDSDQAEAFTLELLKEVEYLRYFYKTADFGPADDDVRYIIRDDYEGEIPEGYGEEE